MNIIYSDMKPEFSNPSIFLAGPTYRDGQKIVEGSFWRREALMILGDLDYDKTVFVPERSDCKLIDYDDQVEWEFECLENCSVIAFWVPRDVQHLPGYTTNVEFGRYSGDRRTVYGRPDDSQKTHYLDWLYRKLRPSTRIMTTLPDLMSVAANKIQKKTRNKNK